MSGEPGGTVIGYRILGRRGGHDIRRIIVLGSIDGGRYLIRIHDIGRIGFQYGTRSSIEPDSHAAWSKQINGVRKADIRFSGIRNAKMREVSPEDCDRQMNAVVVKALHITAAFFLTLGLLVVEPSRPTHITFR